MATQKCLHLGRRDDPSTLFNYPSVGNYCHHVHPLAPPNEEHQAQYCLSGQYQKCPVYQTPAGKHLPPSLLLQTQDWQEAGRPQRLKRFSLRQLGILSAWGVVILLSAVIYVFAANWATLVASPVPILTSTLIPTQPLPTLTPFSLIGTDDTTFLDSGIFENVPATKSPLTLTPSLTPTITPSFTVLPSPTNCVPPLNWVWYTVQVGDTLFSLSRTTGVTVAQLQQANCMSTSTHLVTGQKLSVPQLPAQPSVTSSSSPDPFFTTNLPPTSETPTPTATPVGASTEALNPTLSPTETITPGI